LNEKNIDYFQKNILERLHNHSFTNVLFNLPSNSLEVVCKAGCERLVVSLPIHIFFRLPLDVFSTTLHIRLGLAHNVLGVSHYNCSQPLDLMGIHLLCYACGGGEDNIYNVM
jgi:hypothetical protein